MEEQVQLGETLVVAKDPSACLRGRGTDGGRTIVHSCPPESLPLLQPPVSNMRLRDIVLVRPPEEACRKWKVWELL